MIDASMQSKSEQRFSSNTERNSKLLSVAVMSFLLMSCGGQSTDETQTAEPKLIEENVSDLDKNESAKILKGTIEVSAEVLVLAKVEAELQKSLKAKDYRILATSGRRTTYPGVDISEYDFIKSSCEDRFMPETSDAIKSDEAREARRKVENYMKLYNQRMLVHCKANNG